MSLMTVYVVLIFFLAVTAMRLANIQMMKMRRSHEVVDAPSPDLMRKIINPRQIVVSCILFINFVAMFQPFLSTPCKLDPVPAVDKDKTRLGHSPLASDVPPSLIVLKKQKGQACSILAASVREDGVI